jgi:hypothetical protein
MAAWPGDVPVVWDGGSGMNLGCTGGSMVRGMIGGRHHADHDGELALLVAGVDIMFERMADFHSLAVRHGVCR